jgi:hypothetical protein
MPSEDTKLGNDFRFQLGDGGSPEVFANMCAAIDVAGLGAEKALVEVTSMCDNARTYRNGLADGIEFPLVVNFIQGDTQIRSVYANFQNDTVRTFRLALADTPGEYFEFRAIVRGWNIAPPIGDKATMTFTLKVSGEVTWVQA